SRIVRAAAAAGPGVGIAVAYDVLDPALRHDLRAAARASLHHQLADARETPNSCAHATRSPRRAQAIDRDVSATRCPHRFPEQLGHQIGITYAGRAFDDPAEQIRVRRDVVEGPAVPPSRFRQLAIKGA